MNNIPKHILEEAKARGITPGAKVLPPYLSNPEIVAPYDQWKFDDGGYVMGTVGADSAYIYMKRNFRFLLSKYTEDFWAEVIEPAPPKHTTVTEPAPPTRTTVTVTVEVTDLDTLQMIMEDAVEGFQQTGEGIASYTFRDPRYR